MSRINFFKLARKHNLTEDEASEALSKSFRQLKSSPGNPIAFTDFVATVTILPVRMATKVFMRVNEIGSSQTKELAEGEYRILPKALPEPEQISTERTRNWRENG